MIDTTVSTMPSQSRCPGSSWRNGRVWAQDRLDKIQAKRVRFVEEVLKSNVGTQAGDVCGPIKNHYIVLKWDQGKQQAMARLAKTFGDYAAMPWSCDSEAVPF